MSDSHTPRADGSAEDDARCSAYLEGELTAAEAIAFEARLADEPTLGGTLERTRAALESLAGVGAAEPAPGYGDRLRARLAEVRDQQPRQLADEGPAAGSQPPASLASLPRHRVREARPWMGIAAALVLFAVLGGGLVGVLFGATSGDETAASGAGEADTGGDDAGTAAEPEVAEAEGGDSDADGEESRAFMADPGTEAAAGDSAADDVDDGAPPDDAPAAGGLRAAPSVIDEGVALADGQALADHMGGRQEAVAALGVPLPEVPDHAERAARALESAPPFSDGTRAPDCLGAATSEVNDPALPVRVEALTYADEPVIAYLLVTPGDASEVLDQIEVVLTAPEGCVVRLVQDAPGA
ncbi:hypothetical protein BH23ACT8_BH23ACT8_03480 [soil metagenome]|jgi:hypothetical protein